MNTQHLNVSAIYLVNDGVVNHIIQRQFTPMPAKITDKRVQLIIIRKVKAMAGMCKAMIVKQVKSVHSNVSHSTVEKCLRMLVLDNKLTKTKGYNKRVYYSIKII